MLGRIKTTIKRLDYKFPYRIGKLRSKFGSVLFNSRPQYDVVFVLAEKGWILEGACQEIAKYLNASWKIHYGHQNLPCASVYHFAHYSLLSACLKSSPIVWDAVKTVWFTHPSQLSDKEVVFSLNQADHTICMGSLSVEELANKGVAKDKLSYAVAGADPTLFRPHKRGGGKIGFCTAYYERKNPELLFQIVMHSPQWEFILIGRGWEKYGKFEELCALPNFEYLEGKYAEYPELYEQIDVFVSTSKLEGGPIPLIESMMSNVVPVVSDTGFARDIVDHGKNGYLFSTEASANEVIALIEQALKLEEKVHPSATHLTWERLSQKLQEAWIEGLEKKESGHKKTPLAEATSGAN